MTFSKKIAIAVNLNEDVPKVFETLRESDLLKASEVHFVYSFLTTSYYMGFSGQSFVYPIEEDRKIIEESCLSKLQEASRKIIPEKADSKIVLKCLFADDTKRKFGEYIQAENIDLVIVAAREKRGLFESSFTRFIENHTHANVLVLKQK